LSFQRKWHFVVTAAAWLPDLPPPTEISETEGINKAMSAGSCGLPCWRPTSSRRSSREGRIRR